VLFCYSLLQMKTLEKTPTLRQLAASALRIVGHSSATLARAECAYTKEIVRLGLAERGRPGRGRSQSPAATIEHAEILVLAAALGIPARCRGARPADARAGELHAIVHLAVGRHYRAASDQRAGRWPLQGLELVT
jgi:hypothetical protein